MLRLSDVTASYQALPSRKAQRGGTSAVATGGAGTMLEAGASSALAAM